jgi:hypothetical protein
MNGRYELSLPLSSYYVGTADKANYETTWRVGSYSFTGPNTLNFRLFGTLRMMDIDALHVAVTTDGSICGIDAEWWCRTVHVFTRHAGTLDVRVMSDDPSVQSEVSIGFPISPPCCPSETSAVVSAGQDVMVNVLLWEYGPGGGVLLRTSIQ